MPRASLSSVGLLLLAAGAHAEDHAIAAKFGLLGIGVEYTYQVSDRLSVRGGINGSSYDTDSTKSGIRYDFSLDFDSIAVGVDFHPLKSPLRISAGLVSNDNALTARSTVGQNFTIGGQSYSAEEVGTLGGRIGVDGTAPYVGIGWDWSRNKRVGVSFDIGVLQQGTPKVSLFADGPIAGNPDFLDDLREEEIELSDALDDYDLYPYGTLGVVFRF
jgi:hypothetical protein